MRLQVNREPFFGVDLYKVSLVAWGEQSPASNAATVTFDIVVYLSAKVDRQFEPLTLTLYTKHQELTSGNTRFTTYITCIYTLF
jgi:hypothetical protein